MYGQSSSAKKEVEHSLYLVGDAGRLDNLESKENYVVEGLITLLQKEANPTSVTFLGDNIYPAGLPKKKHKDRDLAEDILEAQMKVSQYFDGHTYFIPGNHDWNRHQKGGVKAVKRQEKFLERKGDGFKDVHFYPNRACADPKVIKINKDLAFVFMDSQWWLHDWDLEKNINHGCDIHSRADLIRTLEEIFIEHKNDQIVLMLHHPVKSQGNHGGNFSFKQHVFPLREVNEKLWIPLPVLGSFYPLSRKVQGSKQDISHPINEEMMDAIVSIALKNNCKVVFASGHDHNLQYFDEGKLKYIVSGSGSETTYVKNEGSATFVKEERGFAKIDFYQNQEAWVEFYQVDTKGKAYSIFRTQMYAPSEGFESTRFVEYPSVSITDTLIAADENKKASKWKRFWMGDQYRDLWTTPVTMRVLDFESELGGLEALKRGGGMSSNSLRIQGPQNKQYVLRSVNKVFTRGLPEQFKNLQIINILRDQNSAYHPYSSWIVSRLAQAAEVYHTDPDFVFLKRQKALKGFNPYFPESIYLFEQRPDGDWSDTQLFGGSDEIISYSELWVNLLEKKHHFVDQKWALKSRLFDLWIHDWDRHDDQWRWAKVKMEDKTYWRPIPRDRDLAFYKFKGAIPSFISKFIIAKYKAMGDDVKDVKNLSFNGKYFDRSYLTGLEWSEWETITKELQTKLSDEVIKTSSRDLPIEIRSMSDEELNSKLKNRRDNLLSISKRFYDLLSTEVEVVGSNHKDVFKVEYKAGGEILVEHYIKDKKGGEILKYDRLFKPSETKEIRLYGLRGKDEFEINGDFESKIKVRIIGGEDNDDVFKASTKNVVSAYDELDGMDLNGGRIKDKRSNELDVNEWDRFEFLYDVPLFLPKFHLNRDGFWIGGTYSKINHAWRAHPYKSKNTISAITAPITQGTFRFDYKGHFPNALGKIDLEPSFGMDFPVNRNFFGFGNESINTASDNNYNWVRMNDIELKSFVTFKHNKHLHFNGGPYFLTYNIYEPGDDEQRYIKDFAQGANYNPFERQYFVGAAAAMKITFVDRVNKPTNGFHFDLDLSYLNEFDTGVDLFSASVQWRTYFPLLKKPEVVLANSIGYTYTKGSFGPELFFLFPSLGNAKGLRGYRNNRYIGERSFFENVDLRIKLFQFNNGILPFDLGILGGYDVGRVWMTNENSDTWHNSKTLGVWFDFLGLAVIQPYYSFTKDGNTLSILTRFNF